jgi:hypothetical protein
MTLKRMSSISPFFIPDGRRLSDGLKKIMNFHSDTEQVFSRVRHSQSAPNSDIEQAPHTEQ